MFLFQPVSRTTLTDDLEATISATAVVDVEKDAKSGTDPRDLKTVNIGSYSHGIGLTKARSSGGLTRKAVTVPDVPWSSMHWRVILNIFGWWLPLELTASLPIDYLFGALVSWYAEWL